MATSCLHLRPENVEGILERLKIELAGLGYGLDDVCIFAGDIIDPTPHWESLRDLLLGRIVLPWSWVKGNHDNMVSPDIGVWGPLSRHSFGKFVLNTGVNIAGPSWAQHHTIATKDEVDRLFGELICDSSDKTEIIVTHYPFVYKGWARDMHLCQHLCDLLKAVPNLKHLVFGHVHMGPDFVPPDGVPDSICVDGKTVKVHLVSDHRERLLHTIE